MALGHMAICAVFTVEVTVELFEQITGHTISRGSPDQLVLGLC